MLIHSILTVHWAINNVSLQIRIYWFFFFFFYFWKSFSWPQLLKETFPALAVKLPDWLSPARQPWTVSIPGWLLLPLSHLLIVPAWVVAKMKWALSDARLRSLKCQENWLNQWFPLLLTSCRITSPTFPLKHLPCSMFTSKSNSLRHCPTKCSAV